MGEVLFNTIAMVDVNINVQNTCMVFQQFEDGKDNVVYITESGSCVSLSMMKTARPAMELVRLDFRNILNCNIRVAMIEFLSCANRTPTMIRKRKTKRSVYPAEIAQNSYMPGHIGQSSPQLSRTIQLHLDNQGHTAIHLRLISILYFWSNVPQKSHVLVRMKFCHFKPVRRLGNLQPQIRLSAKHSEDKRTYTHIQLLVHVVVQYQVVHHSHSMRLHRMWTLAYPEISSISSANRKQKGRQLTSILIVSYIVVVKV